MNSTYLNPKTDGYDLVDNEYLETQSAISKANVLLLMPIGSYIYNMKMGNPLLNKKGLLNKSEIENDINYALQPLLDSGDITAVSILEISITPTKKNIIKIQITLPTGKEIIDWSR